MTENTFGIDISAYQYGRGKLVDFDRMKAQDPRPAHGQVRADPAWTQLAGVKFCAVRATLFTHVKSIDRCGLNPLGLKWDWLHGPMV